MRTLRGRIGGTGHVLTAARNYPRPTTAGVFATAAISLTACGISTPPAPPEDPPKELSAVCADSHNIRVDESFCPSTELSDEEGYGTGEYEPSYWDATLPNGPHWMFYGQNPNVIYLIPEYGYPVAGTGGTYLLPTINNYINTNGYMPATGGTITRGSTINTKPGSPTINRGGFGITEKGTSSGS